MADSVWTCFSRVDAVRQTLCRHVTLKCSVESEKQKEHFVVDELHVPVEWLHDAKVSTIDAFYCVSFACQNSCCACIGLIVWNIIIHP